MAEPVRGPEEIRRKKRDIREFWEGMPMSVYHKTDAIFGFMSPQKQGYCNSVKSAGRYTLKALGGKFGMRDGRFLEIGPSDSPQLRGNGVVYADVSRLGLKKPFATGRAVQADGEALPFRGGTFNGCATRFLFPYVSDHGRLIDEVRKALKPGGHWVITENASTQGTTGVIPGFGGIRFKQLSKLLEARGFKVAYSRDLGHNLFLINAKAV